MSNPAVNVLSRARIHGVTVSIEDNLGESIHIHIGDFRFEFTINEFMCIADKFYSAAKALVKEFNIDLDMFDSSAFDWMWFHRYSEISKIEISYVKLRELLTRENRTINGKVINKIMPISETIKYKALCEVEEKGNTDLVSSEELVRLRGLYTLLQRNKYPVNSRYILVNQFFQIYDGDHRSVCLYKLKGSDYTVPVVKITFNNEQSLAQQFDIEKEEINKKEKIIIPQKQWSDEMNILDVTFEDFINSLMKKKYNFFVVDYPLHNDLFERVSDVAIVIPHSNLIQFCKDYFISYYGENAYRHYGFLYSMQRAIFIRLKNKDVYIFDNLCCKSKFENSFVPLDRTIQDYAINNLQENAFGVKYCNKLIKLIVAITYAMFNSNGFNEIDKEYISREINHVDLELISNLLEKVFFKYTHKLLSYIKTGKYELAYNEFILNIGY